MNAPHFHGPDQDPLLMLARAVMHSAKAARLAAVAAMMSAAGTICLAVAFILHLLGGRP